LEEMCKFHFSFKQTGLNLQPFVRPKKRLENHWTVVGFIHFIPVETATSEYQLLTILLYKAKSKQTFHISVKLTFRKPHI